MRLAVATLCDAANVREGTLSVLGAGLNTLLRAEYPAPLGLWFALLLEVPPAESGRTVRLEIRVQECNAPANAEPLALVEGEFTTEEAAGTSTYVPMPLDFSAVGVPSAGEYELVVQVAGKEHARVPFYARLAPPETTSFQASKN